jgi:hypothetical protein
MNYLNLNYYAEGWMRDYYFYFYDDTPLDWDRGMVDMMSRLGHFHDTSPMCEIGSFIKETLVWG